MPWPVPDALVPGVRGALGLKQGLPSPFQAREAQEEPHMHIYSYVQKSYHQWKSNSMENLTAIPVALEPKPQEVAAAAGQTQQLEMAKQAGQLEK